VDWPSTSVPRALISAGFTVLGYSPGRYSKAEVVLQRPEDDESVKVFPPKHDETGYLVFRRLDGWPSTADIICVYRPAEELPGILADHGRTLGAKAVWLQRPATSAQERVLVEEHGLIFVEDCDIAETARTLRKAELQE